MATRQLLANAKEEDLYLSHISPLGIPFNNIKGTTNEIHKAQRIAKDKAGSSCPRKYLALDKTHDPEGICTASRKYQTIELDALKNKKETMSEVAYQQKFNAITEKACLCIGLANASFLENDLQIKGESQGVVICPGPNIAYFTKEVSLKQMMQHIYGRTNIIDSENRPHFFLKELRMYLDHFKQEKSLLEVDASPIKMKKIEKTKENLLAGIAYYELLFAQDDTYFTGDQSIILKELNESKITLLHT